jgi:glycosyltransferase involved in cell wall biosynthesis
MRILVSALLVNTTPGKSFAGVGRHMFQVLNQLTLTPTEHHYEVFVRNDQEIPATWKNCSWITWHMVAVPNSKQRILWEHFKLGSAAKRLGCSAIVCLFIHLPLFSSVPIIAFAHDAFPRTHGEWFPPRKRFLLDQLTRHACKKSSVLITVSDFSRSELSRSYKISPDKILVAPNGLGNDLVRMPVDQALRLVRAWCPKADSFFR